MRGSTRVDDQSVLLHLAFLASECSLTTIAKKTKSLARFNFPVSALDLGYKRGFFWKHVFSSRPKRLQKLHWDTLQVAYLCPLLPQRLHHFQVNFSGLSAELFATVPLDNKATFSLPAVAVCRLRVLSEFFKAFFTSAEASS